ncbi:MAG: EAL domain-containing protein [Gallionella sp.]|nr:EAL domain-containing protein [Gallionella sp.]MDD4958920.1 EAL domain-containing protein [Gallionella sp.]
MKTSDEMKSTYSALRAAAEAQLGNSQPHEVWTLHAEKLLHELHVHQIELEMQNEALRQAQQALEESRDRFVDLYEFAPVGYLTLTVDGMIADINLTAVTLLGRERDKLLNRSLRMWLIDDDKDRWVRHFKAVKNRTEKISIELSLLRGDDTVFQAQLDCVSNGATVRSTLIDITERKLIEEELRIAAVAFLTQNGIMITNSEGVIQRVNPAFTQLTGYTANEAIGKTPAMLQSDRQDSLFYQQMWLTLKENGYWQGEIWNKRKNGQIYAEMLNITAIYSSEQRVTHYVGSFSDITQNKEAEAEIHRLAYYDSLTKLPNRRLLQDRLDQAIIATARSGMYGAMFFIDIDHFKALNDSRGHDVGDLLLVDVAQRLLDGVRENDTVARQGGDEFVVLMETLGKTADETALLAASLGDKLRMALAAPFNLRGYEYHCKTSIGIGLFDAQSTVEELFKHADLALYQAKTSGRDRLHFFDPAMQDALEQRSILEAALRQVVALQQLRLYYQPQLDAKHRVVGVEALVRWQHPQRGLVLPDAFIPLAEDTGLILPIGHWVLETASEQIKAWENDTQMSVLQIAVNVSARQFNQPDFVKQVQNVLASSGANPARLKLELTESMLLEDVQDTIAKMHAIKQLGVLFSMDDFGTGYSSLSYLAQLPLDQLKIDKSFVRNISRSKNDESIVCAIITLGLGLKMNVIAEGVETEVQRVFLAMHGCHEYQGDLFSRPLPLPKLEAFLKLA